MAKLPKTQDTYDGQDQPNPSSMKMPPPSMLSGESFGHTVFTENGHEQKGFTIKGSLPGLNSKDDGVANN